MKPTNAFPWNYVAATAFAAALSLNLGAASAQDFPSGPVEVITHGSAGGGTDTTARMVIRHAEDILGVEMPVVMKLGAGGAVALNYAVQQGPGGHHTILTTSSHVLTIAQGRAPVNMDGIVGVARAADDPVIVVARPGGRFETIQDLMDVSEGSVKWATSMVGALDHVAAESFSNATATPVDIVPYDGGGAAVTSVIGGDADVASPNAGEAMEQIQRGDLVALAVMADERLELLPEVPTLAEFGHDVTFSTVRGFTVLKGTPEEEIAILEEKLLEAMNTEEYREFLVNNGMPVSSVAGREVWDAQIRGFHDEARGLLEELGMVQ